MARWRLLPALCAVALLAAAPPALAEGPAARPPGLDAVLAERDSGRSREALRALVQRTLDGKLRVVELYPHVGALREKLLAALGDPAWQAGRTSPAARARHLLSLWHDPRDRVVIEAFLRESKRFAARAPRGISQRWRDHHFTREGFPDRARRTANWTRSHLGADGRRALVVHEVRYAHWGYEMQLVFTRVRGPWELQLVLHTRRDHFGH
jgi:hypothetical protein